MSRERGSDSADIFKFLRSVASHADVLSGSSRVPAPRTYAESKDKFLSHCSQISAGDHMQIIGDPIGPVEVKVLTSQTHIYIRTSSVECDAWPKTFAANENLDKIFRSMLHGFCPFPPVSLTELCSFWYGLKHLFTLQKLADKVAPDVKTDDVTSGRKDLDQPGGSGANGLSHRSS